MSSENAVLEDIQFSLELLKQGRIEEAREYLESINHPKAKEFLAQLDETVATPKSSPVPKPRSTISDERRQELTRQREERRQQGTGRAAPVIDESRVSIFEAWKRNIQATLHKEMWWVAIGAAIAVGIVLLALSTATLGIGLLLLAPVAIYLFIGQEITRMDETTGAVTRIYQFNNWPHYQVKTSPPQLLEYTGEALPTTYPASISSFYALTLRDDREVAATVIRSAIISLWARGIIKVYAVKITRSIFDVPIEQSPPTTYALTLAPDTTKAEVEGVIEQHLVKTIRNYFGNNVPRLFARPWQHGPTPYELTYEYMGKTHYEASQRVINVVRNDPVFKRVAVNKPSGKQRFTVTAQHEGPLREEGALVLRAATGQTAETRAFTTALSNGVTAAVRQRTATKNN